MARITTIQSFGSVGAIKDFYKITLPKPYDWRLLVPNVVGEVNGIPSSRGVAVATNGILVAIVQTNALFIGHLEFFVPDEEEVLVVALEKTTTRKKQTIKKTEPEDEFI